MNRRLLAGVGVLNLLIVLVGWFALISPQQHDAATAAAKAHVAQVELALLGGGGSKGPTTQPAIHTANIYALDTALPAQVDQPDLLFELDRIATASGVKILGLSPQPGQAVASGYTMQPINLTLDGTYFNVTRFLRTLRMLVSERNGKLIANGPLFSVSSVGITPGAAAGKNDAATVSIAAYYYGTVAGATPPPSTSTTDTTTTTGG